MLTNSRTQLYFRVLIICHFDASLIRKMAHTWLLLVSSGGPPNLQTVQTTKIISHIKEKRKETCCLQRATGSVSLDLGPNEREVKNFHFLPAIIAVATFIPKRFSSRCSAQPVIDSEMSACPQNPATISSFPPLPFLTVMAGPEL